MGLRGRVPEAAPVDDVALGALEEVLGYHVARAAVVTVGLFERHVGDRFGLRKVEFSILMLLAANAALSPKRLGQVLLLSPPNLTLLLDRLQERSLLRRERNPLDGRSQNVVLTDAGRALASEAAAAARTMEAELSARLSAAEHAMLIELLRKATGR
ncbi:MAG: MarR family transcriptional regulator [Aquabacterium sp.]|nr:MarR family transcriptional regulator [Aquabacterium sp.]